MPPLPVHMVIENGPMSGREISVTDIGIRIGRSSNNDIVLKDPALSRFHCIVFFKPNEGLWAMDIGSVNQTFINGKVLTEQRIFPGDHMTLGETSIKVISDRPDGSQSTSRPPPPPAAPEQKPPEKEQDKPQLQQAPPEPPEQTTPETKPPASKLPVLEKANLFGKPQPSLQGNKAPDSNNKLFLLVVVAIVGLSLIIMAVLSFFPKHNPSPTNKPTAQALDFRPYIKYEKVQAGPDNIFRYALLLDNGFISIEIDDLHDNRHVQGNQRHKVDDSLLRELADKIERSGFFGGLKEEYRGAAKGVSDTLDLTIILGERSHRVRIDNSLEPDAFKSLREAIEEFGQNELGLGALALPPEQLLERSSEAFRLGQDLYGQREVKSDNLWRAIRAMTEAEWYLETIEPKPDYYSELVAKLSDYKQELDERCNNRNFLAERAIKLKEWSQAAAELRAICDEIPDRADSRHDAARKKLIDVERRIFKK